MGAPFCLSSHLHTPHRAAFIPAVKRIFRRPSSSSGQEADTPSSTEYAFARSKTLLARILDSVRGRSGLASLAFFVFAALYIFQNEVSLRVARTVSRRLRRLGGKIESGEGGGIDEKDLELLKGWRWRVLMWGE